MKKGLLFRVETSRGIEEVFDRNSNDLIQYGLPKAKYLIKKELSNGEKNPEVSIHEAIVDNNNKYIGYTMPAWTIITKKDVAEKITNAQELTEYELETLKEIVKSYITSGVENTDYYNVFGFDDRKRRGALGSLTRKQVVNRNNCPECFNSIYPSHTFKATCEKYNIDISKVDSFYLR